MTPRTKDDLLVELTEAHRALDELGVPRQIVGQDLALGARISHVRRAAKESAKAEVWSAIESIARPRS